PAREQALPRELLRAARSQRVDDPRIVGTAGVAVGREKAAARRIVPPRAEAVEPHAWIPPSRAEHSGRRGFPQRQAEGIERVARDHVAALVADEQPGTALVVM